MNFPRLSDLERLTRLTPPAGKVRMVLDTDTYNEIDDQFALVYALLSPEKLDLEAIYAAPFHNDRSSGPGHGMELSYDEILRLLKRMDVSPEGFVYKGSMDYVGPQLKAQENDAVHDLIARAKASSPSDPLYVVAIGAISNVASAMMLEPDIIKNIVVVWLGGHALHWPHAVEFNLKQDVSGAQILFDSGVPLVLIPCGGVTTHLHSTVPEIERYVEPYGDIGAFLAQRFKEYSQEHIGWSKVIWDMANIAYLLNDSWVPTELVHSPILTDQVTWSVDRSRHLIRCANYIRRDPIFKDFFVKLAAFSS